MIVIYVVDHRNLEHEYCHLTVSVDANCSPHQLCGLERLFNLSKCHLKHSTWYLQHNSSVLLVFHCSLCSDSFSGSSDLSDLVNQSLVCFPIYAHTLIFF